MQIVKINGEELKFKYCWGALYRYEMYTDVELNLKKHAVLHLLYWCILEVNNPGMKLTQDAFCEAMDASCELGRALDEAFALEMDAWSVGVEDKPAADADDEAQKKS